MEYVYVLQSQKDYNFYVGWTNNLRKRLDEHNTGKVFSTTHRKPVKLIYCEISTNRNDAKQRERYLKTAWGKRYIKNRLRTYLTGYK
jgi:putative endonuclease